MTVVVHNPRLVIQFLLLKTKTILPPRSKSNSVTNNAQSLDALTVRNLRACCDNALHNALRNVGIWLRLPVADIVHDIAAAVLDSRRDQHGTALVAHHDNLSARRRHGLILDTAELEGA
ncbi:hypothetical protein HG530_010037 [Fusarium avenaceum]|nr:hypothetical protein HG530_010037 [Fusarium avenaceum]